MSTVKIMVGYFGLTHPCPYCRYDFLSWVSRNDARWEDLGQNNEVTGVRYGRRKLVSESELYPLEYLFLGGSMAEKLETIVDGPSLMLFFWKIHNAVTSSISGSLQCKMQEETDDPKLLAILPLTTFNAQVPPPRPATWDAPGRQHRGLSFGSEVTVISNERLRFVTIVLL